MHLTERKNLTILKLDGSILESNSQELDLKFNKMYANSSRNVIVDLTDANHICSLVLGLLVAHKKKFNENSGDIKIVVTDEDLLELFEITMLNKIFDIFVDIKSAEEAFKIDKI